MSRLLGFALHQRRKNFVFLGSKEKMMMDNIDRLYDRAVADELVASRLAKSDTMNELLRLAIAEHPDLAMRLMDEQRKERTANMERINRLVEIGEEMEREAYFKRLSERKIFYNDKRPRNKLLGMRRSWIYQSLSRKEQIQYEIDNYYTPYHLQPPPSLIREKQGLTVAEEMEMRRRMIDNLRSSTSA